MRVLPTLVVAESAALIVLGLIWLFHQDARPLDAVRGAATGESAASPGARGAEVDRGASRSDAPDDAPVRRDAPGRWDPAVGVVVRGRITTTDGSPAPEEFSIGFRRGAHFRAGVEVGDRYAVAALEPGTWQLRATADAFAVLEEDHELGSEPVQTIDVALEPAHVVKVFVTTADDSPLRESEAVRDLGLHWGLQVVATERPLAGDLSPTDNVSVGDIGIGRYRSARDPGGRPGPGDPDGELWLDRPPPANAALLLRHVVLAQQPIAVGQRELRFVVDTDELRGRFGTVTLRLVDGATGQPIAGGTVRFSTAQGGGSFGKADGEGRVVVERVLPGLASLEIYATKEREGLWDLVRVPAGGTVDLGDVVLHPQVEVRGRLVDAAGQPVADGRVQWTNLETMDFPRELVNRRSASPNGDGEFQIWGAGPHRYVVIARDPDGRMGYAVVDARAGAPPPVEIELVEPASVAVELTSVGFEGFVATIRDAEGVPVAASNMEPRFPTHTLRVPPGSYTLEVHGRGDRLVKRVPIDARAGVTRTVVVP